VNFLADRIGQIGRGISGDTQLISLTFGRCWGSDLVMARLAWVVAPGYPHHVTQRGNRRMQTFFGDEDRRAYLAPLGRGLTPKKPASPVVAAWRPQPTAPSLSVVRGLRVACPA